MDFPSHASVNTLSRILHLPEELKRMVFTAILPSHIQIEYIAAHWKVYRGFSDPPTPRRSGPLLRLKYSSGIYHPTQHLVTKAWYAAAIDFISTTTVWDLGTAGRIERYRARDTKSGCLTCRQRHKRCDNGWPTCEFCSSHHTRL